jgi:hypothetical protein
VAVELPRAVKNEYRILNVWYGLITLIVAFVVSPSNAYRKILTVTHRVSSMGTSCCAETKWDDSDGQGRRAADLAPPQMLARWAEDVHQSDVTDEDHTAPSRDVSHVSSFVNSSGPAIEATVVDTDAERSQRITSFRRSINHPVRNPFKPPPTTLARVTPIINAVVGQPAHRMSQISEALAPSRSTRPRISVSSNDPIGFFAASRYNSTSTVVLVPQSDVHLGCSNNNNSHHTLSPLSEDCMEDMVRRDSDFFY